MPVDEKSNINTKETFLQHMAPPPFAAFTPTIKAYIRHLQRGPCSDTHRSHHKLCNCPTCASLCRTASTAEGVLTTCQSCNVIWASIYIQDLNFGRYAVSKTRDMRIALQCGNIRYMGLIDREQSQQKTSYKNHI